MTFDIQGVLDFDDSFHYEFEKLAKNFMQQFSQSAYPATALSLVGLMGSANSIKLGIYDLAEKSDTHLYVTKILHRTLIEHYLKFYYLLHRFLNEKTDDIGIEYRKYSKISEVLAYLNASDVANTMIEKPTNEQVLEQLKKEFPEFNISKKELLKITTNWKHRNIVRYLKQNSGLIQEGSYILKLIPEYAELSSFVHGGIFAEEYYHQYFGNGSLEQQMYLQVAESCFIAASIKMHLMLVVIEIDSSYLEGMLKLATKITEFIDKFPFHPSAIKSNKK